jgi:hypothetical protein
MSSPGARGGWDQIIPTRNLMEDKEFQPTMREQLALGVGKAHRNVVYSHYEYRNFEKGSDRLGSSARVRGT